ncbi:hypothetical protein JZM24_17850 [Candidatus Sodalis endolongispinus]|uniref:Uncharacterized protein n=1 Tax=Candidatus Sodalis endolongispinus TaxID=2812662 RepID=A0ABS5YEX8_9GAMM|nr:hypothetical protein [Candidatus Sodalis endolongispinus]MBT9433491.1 hypothetical protein [Candidatus Sodalis endolongispinus]
MSVRLRKVLGDERPQSGMARRYPPAVMRPEALTDRRRGALLRTVRLRRGEEIQAETGLAFHRASLRRVPIAAAYAFVGLFGEQHDKAGARVRCAVERAFLDRSWAGRKTHSHAPPLHALWAGIPVALRQAQGQIFLHAAACPMGRFSGALRQGAWPILPATPPHGLRAGIPGAGLHGLQAWFASIFAVAPWGVIITRAIFIIRHIVVRMVAQH